MRIAFGVDKEDLERFIIPISENGRETIGSKGYDTPPAIISPLHRKFYDYFKQSFAQVTNPAIDSIRERYVMSLYRYIGSESDLLSDSEEFSGGIRIESPILSPREVKLLKEKHYQFPHVIVNCNCHVNEDLAERIEEIRIECENAV